jgi:hypothetical protein
MATANALQAAPIRLTSRIVGARGPEQEGERRTCGCTDHKSFKTAIVPMTSHIPSVSHRENENYHNNESQTMSQIKP